MEKLRSDCQCTFDNNHITNALLQCAEDNTVVIFRATLYSTFQHSYAELTNYLREWVASGTAGITFSNIRLAVESDCEVEIQSLDDPLCSGSIATTSVVTTSSQSDETGKLLWPIVGAIAGGVVLILVVIIALHIFNRIRRKSKFELRYTDHYECSIL